MGNNQGFDHSKQTGLYVRTEKPFYFAGETVSGHIYLSVGGGAFQSSQIYLKVKGYEKAKWSETKTVWETVPGSNPPQQRSKQVTEHFDNENEFYQYKIPVYNFQQGFMPPGQYTFPFSFQLKSNLPGSFEYTEKDLLCKIKYSVKAEIESPNKSIDDIKHKQEFIVRETIKEGIQEVEGSQVLQPTSCCCIPMGTIMFKFQFDKNVYLPGEVAKLQVEVDNTQSKINIPTINGTLNNTLRIVSKQGHQRLIVRHCGTTMVPGVQAGQGAQGEQKKIMTLHLSDQNKNQPLEPTTNGKIVQNNYQLSGTGELDGICLCCTQTPGLQFPIRIAAKPIASYEQPVVAPPGWNPQVMNPVQVQFNDQYRYQPARGGNLVQQQNPQQDGYQNPNQPFYG